MVWLFTPEQARRIGDAASARIEESGQTRSEVAKLANISEPVLYRILAGTEFNPKFATMRGVFEVLNLPLALLFAESNYVDLRKATLPLIGQAEVGVFRTDKPLQSGTIADATPLDQRYIEHSRFGVVVRDSSLDAIVSAPEATSIIALVIAWNPEMGLDHGRIYLVHRANRDGQIETAFRRAAVYHDRYEFEALFADAAKNARHLLVVPDKDLASTQVEIGGLFYAATCQYL